MINSQNRKIMYIGGAILVVGTIAYIVVTIIQNQDKTATIDVQSAVPTDIKVTVDGNQVNSNGKVAVTPGSHKLVAQRSGFATKTQTTDVKKGETKTVRFLLTPINDEGYAWARDHPEAFAEYEAQAGGTYDTQSVDLGKKYPLIAQLPEIHATWRIDYGKSEAHPNDPNSLAIIITYSGNEIDKQNALDWIKNQGYKIGDYEVIYRAPSTSGD